MLTNVVVNENKRAKKNKNIKNIVVNECKKTKHTLKNIKFSK